MGDFSGFFGRRSGRRLRPHKAELLTTLLPKYQIILSEQPCHPTTLFTPSIRSVWLEIGFGHGEHLAAVALAHPHIGMIGCEPFINGIAHLLRLMEHHRLENIRIFPDDAHLLVDRLAQGSIDRCFVLFADPWPKKRHHKRRLITPACLNRLAYILTDAAELRLASDESSLVRWMLEHTWSHAEFLWLARSCADWRGRTADWPASRYEEKALSAGRKNVFLRFQRRIRTAL